MKFYFKCKFNVFNVNLKAIFLTIGYVKLSLRNDNFDEQSNCPKFVRW